MWTARPHKHQVCTQVQDPIVTTGYHLAGTIAKSKIVAEHQAQQHSQAEVPSSDSTKVTTVMKQPVQPPQLQTIHSNANLEIWGRMNTQVGVVNAPTAGVSFLQTHAHLINWILDSQLSIDYFTNPSLMNDVHDSK